MGAAAGAVGHVGRGGGCFTMDFFGFPMNFVGFLTHGFEITCKQQKNANFLEGFTYPEGPTPGPCPARHVQIQIVCQNLHLLDLEHTFEHDSIMIMHGFCWGRSKKMLTKSSNYISHNPKFWSPKKTQQNPQQILPRNPFVGLAYQASPAPPAPLSARPLANPPGRMDVENTLGNIF